MAEQAPQSQAQAPAESKPNDKELNFRMLEAKYEKQLAQERAARLEAERRVEERSRQAPAEDDEDDSEPYVDHKKLTKKLSSFEKKLEEKFERKVEEKARSMMDKDKADSWMRANPDFYEVMQHADKFAEKNPELAESILRMPDGIDRQKLVYANIKTLGIHKPEEKKPSIQEKVDANRRSPFYQPTGVTNAPYSAAGDFSEGGQKQAYQKMQELKKSLRI